MATLVTAALLLPTFYVMPATGVEPSLGKTWVGGPAEAPSAYMLNDHTVYGVRWRADNFGETTTTLVPNTTYYMKIRMSPVAGTGSDTERGFTWRPPVEVAGEVIPGEWIHVRDQDWKKR